MGDTTEEIAIIGVICVAVSLFPERNKGGKLSLNTDRKAEDGSGIRKGSPMMQQVVMTKIALSTPDHFFHHLHDNGM